MEIAKQVVKNSKIYSRFLAVMVDEKLYDLSAHPSASATIKFLTFDDPKGKEIFWHSAAHVLGAALERRYNALLGHGPT